MDDIISDAEIRKQRARHRLGTAGDRCFVCGESYARALELHHLAGVAQHPYTVAVCRVCHRKLSDAQQDHPVSVAAEPYSAMIGHFLLGLADMLRLLADQLIEFGRGLIGPTEQAAARGSK